MTTRRLRIGIAGLGRAFSIMQPALASEKLEIVAGADPRSEARDLFRREFSGSGSVARGYATIEEMCGDGAVEAVWRIEVEDFPAFILVDDKGNDFFQHVAPGCTMSH